MSETAMDTKPLPPSSEPLPATLDPAPGAPEPAPLAPAAPSLATVESHEVPLRDVFIGPDGSLYAGTRWLIYLALGGALYFLLDLLLDAARPLLRGELRWNLATQILLALAAILPAFVMARIEKRPFGNFGLPPHRAFRRSFWVGTLWGIASLTVLMLALRLAGAFKFGSLALHGTRIVKFAAYWAVCFLLTGFFEEFLLRGYSLWVFARGMNFWPAAALLSVAFGAIHSGNPGESKTGLAAAALIGFFFCLTLRRTGDLWWAVGFHMSWDWGESYLYSVPDSGGMATGHLLNSSFHGPVWLTGGTVGPEGSYLIFILIAALWLLFDRLYPEVKYGEVRRSD